MRVFPFSMVAWLLCGFCPRRSPYPRTSPIRRMGTSAGELAASLADVGENAPTHHGDELVGPDQDRFWSSHRLPGGRWPYTWATAHAVQPAANPWGRSANMRTSARSIFFVGA